MNNSFDVGPMPLPIPLAMRMPFGMSQGTMCPSCGMNGGITPAPIMIPKSSNGNPIRGMEFANPFNMKNTIFDIDSEDEDS